MATKAKKSEAVAPVEEAKTLAPAVSERVDLNAWGVPQANIAARDIVIPKILAMQAMSKPVTAGEAKMGEFRDSLNGVVIGDIGSKPVEFIPFFMQKVFVVMREDKGTWKFNRQVEITPANEGHEFMGKGEDGAQEKWYYTMNFYVLLPSEIKANGAIPYILSFRSSSARAGQKIATTMFMKNLKANKTPASMVMQLTGSKKTNDKGTFVVMDAKELRESTKEEVAEAFTWVKTILGGKVKVDHSDLEAETEATPMPEAPDTAEY